MVKKTITIISGSCNPDSSTNILTSIISKRLEKRYKIDTMDLRFLELPRCGVKLDNTEQKLIKELNGRVAKSSAVIICSPIYGQHMTGVLKDLLDFLYVLKGKPVLFCEKLATELSFLAAQNIYNYLIFAHYAFVFPRFLMVNDKDFATPSKLKPQIEERLIKLLEGFEIFTRQINAGKINL